MKLPRLEHIGVAYQDRYQSIHKVEADFLKFRKTYYVHDHGERVGIVVPHRGKVLLVEQYRLLVNGLSLEIPGGKVDTGESPKESALRELFEETGIDCADARLLLNYLPGMDTFRNPTWVYLASRPRTATAFRPNAKEISRTIWVPLPQVIEMIFAGKISCGLSILAILAYTQQRSTKQTARTRRAL